MMLLEGTLLVERVWCVRAGRSPHIHIPIHVYTLTYHDRQLQRVERRNEQDAPSGEAVHGRGDGRLRGGGLLLLEPGVEHEGGGGQHEGEVHEEGDEDAEGLHLVWVWCVKGGGGECGGNGCIEYV